jgi:hypothetical protein
MQYHPSIIDVVQMILNELQRDIAAIRMHKTQATSLTFHVCRMDHTKSALRFKDVVSQFRLGIVLAAAIRPGTGTMDER